MEYNPFNPTNQLITTQYIESILANHGCKHNVTNISIFQESMVHSSYVKRNVYISPTGDHTVLAKKPQNCMDLCDRSYEQLEHLGDSVWGLVVTTYLSKRFPDADEGFLTNTRKVIVCNKQLGKFAIKIGLDKFYIISRHNEDSCNGRKNESKLADIMESFLGALWKDCNYNFAVVYSFINGLLSKHDYIDLPGSLQSNSNFKDQLQKFCQNQKQFTPKYVMLSDSDNGFMMAAIDNQGLQIGIGHGKTKKEGEQKAAENALNKIKL